MQAIVNVAITQRSSPTLARIKDMGMKHNDWEQ